MQTNTNWSDIKSVIQNHWHRLGDKDMNELEGLSLNGDLTQLERKIMRVYGYNKVEAESQIEKFKRKFEAPNTTRH